MKKILFIISFFVSFLIGFSQAPVNRSSSVVTAVDSRLRAALNFGIPITNDTTLNGGLDSLGSFIYAKLYHSVFVRDSNMVGGGHKWTNMLSGQGITSLNGQANSSQTFAIGSAGTGPNVSSSGGVHTFNFPYANTLDTGVVTPAQVNLWNGKVNISDTATMLANYVRNISLGLPSTSFATPLTFVVSGHTATATATYLNQSNNTFLAGPSTGGVGPVSWRLMVNSDLPISSVTPGSYTNSNITVNQQGIIIGISNGSGSGAGGTVTSIGMVVPSAFSVSPSTITTNGVFTISAIGNSGQYINGAGALTTFPNIPALINPTCASGCTITGTYPNLIWTITGSGGTVTNVTSGNLANLFTVGIATSTTTPAFTFTAITEPQFTIFGNNTAGTAAPTFFAPTLASLLFQNQGTVNTLLHGNAGGAPSWAAVSLVNDVTGNLGVTHLNGGTGATGSTFWRGDGIWATPSGGGTVTSVGVVSTDLSVAGSPITGSGNFTLNINTNAVTYAKFQQVAASSLVGNPTGSLANAQGIPLGYGLKFVGTSLAFDSALVKDTVFAVEGLSAFGSTGDSIGLGGFFYQNATISGRNLYALTFDSFPALSGHGFRVNFGSDAGLDMIYRDSATGFWRSGHKGTPGQVWGMPLSGGLGWVNQTGGGSSLTRQNITSGSSGTVTGGNFLVNFNPASAISTYALTMPAAPSDMQVVEIEAGGTITGGASVVTTFSIVANSGQTIHQSVTPTTLKDGDYLKYRYNASLSIWYREN